MKAALVGDSSGVTIENIDTPKIGPGDILVKMQACGICGSDLEKVFGKYGQPSRRLGHEPSGIIEKVGENVSGFQQGDRVFVHHHVPCYTCHYCKHGNETMCPKYYETNLLPCGLSEEFVVPEWNVTHGGVIKISNSVTFDEAAMIEPLACCVRAWNKFSHQKGDSTAVLGVGPTGMMHVMLAKSYGFDKIFCIDVNQFRLDFAKQFGITEAIHSNDVSCVKKIFDSTDNQGVDVAIVATGNLTALKQSIELVRKGGTIILFGVPSKGDTIEIDMSKVYSKEISVIPTYAASDDDTNAALKLIESSSIDVKKLITHRYSLDKSKEAFEHAHEGSDSMKIIITN